MNDALSLKRERSQSSEMSAETQCVKKLRHDAQGTAEEQEQCPAVGTINPLVESKASSPGDTPVTPKPECVSCACEDVEILVKVPCHHHYCRDCFESFVGASLESHDVYPPKCCRIPLAFKVVAENISKTLFHRYQTRQDEIKNATALYCGVLGCGVRIQPNKIDGPRATCVTCTRDTCTMCRGEMPMNPKDKHICTKDQAREAAPAPATAEGWQRCYQCGTKVALNVGSHHMICRCGAQFCYNCSTVWKTCACEYHDEPRLLDRANRAMGIRAARRIARGLPPDPRPREKQVADLQHKLQPLRS